MEGNERKVILLIEDESVIRNNVEEILASDGFSVVALNNGENASNVSKKLKPDLVLCDIMMPGKSGIEVCIEFQENKELSLVPFVFLTAKSDVKDIRTGMNLGADDYIVKPFRAADLLDSIHTRLKKANNIKELVPKQSESSKTKEYSIDSTIFIPDRKDPQTVKIKDIIAVIAESKYSFAFLRSGKKKLFPKLLKDWESLLPSNHFARIHRSTIINVNEVKSIIPWFKKSYKVIMNEFEDEFIISERYVKKLKDQSVLF